MTKILEKKFKNEELGIEFESYIDEECCAWFKAKKVAQILGYKNTDDAVKRHVSENHKKTFLLSCPRESRGQVIKDKKSCPPETGGQVQGRWIIFIDEAGFYELVFKSRLPAVKFYKHDVFTNYAANKDGDVINLKTKKIMKMCKNNSGYLYFNIYNKKLKKTKSYAQHRFVYEVFKDTIPSYLEVDHINNLKTDNRIKNLQLLTHKQNVGKSLNKKIISNCIATGEKRKFISIKKASIELDINKRTISNICCKRKHYKTATSKKDGKKYTFKFID